MVDGLGLVPARYQQAVLKRIPHHLHLVHLSFFHNGPAMTTTVSRPPNGISTPRHDAGPASFSKPTLNGHQPNGDAAKEPSSERVQIIDDEKRFTYACSIGFQIHRQDSFSICRAELTPQLTRWGLQDAGFDYDIVAVFGSQSTGKSAFWANFQVYLRLKWCTGTLLNRLFGTDFDVMDETKRQQTTKGS